MRRKIYDELVKWKHDENGKVALLIDGARRVGKSYIVEEFAKKNYKSYILIDFSKVNNDIKNLFEDFLDDLDSLFMYLSNYYNIELFERDTLIIFDEIQLCPKARSSIKFLVADGRYDYIETGSLMSIKKNVKDILIPSEERHINMHPMDFEEFLWALDNSKLMNAIRLSFEKKKPLGQAIHRKAMNYFRQYVIVGGMPQAVLEYVQTKDFKRTDQIKRDILNLYKEDIYKHADNNALKVGKIFEEIPASLGKEQKKFKLSMIDENARMREYSDAFFWLNESRIINICYNSVEPSIGLKTKINNSSLKCYMADTGLLISHSFDENGIVDEEIYKKILFDKLEFNGGMIAENIVAQMLKSSNHQLYYYFNNSRDDKDSRMEIDFLISKNKINNRHNISPIEVKSSSHYTLTSLKKFLIKYDKQLYTPYVIHVSDLKIEDGIVYLPIYMTELL